MYPRRFLVMALVGLLIAGLLFAGIGSAQRSAWTQGYLMGRLSASGDGSKLPPPDPYLYSGGYAGPHSGGLGVFFLIGLVLLALATLGRLFRPWGWHHGEPGNTPGGRQGEKWAPHWRRPPWWNWEQPGESPAAKPGTGEGGQRV